MKILMFGWEFPPFNSGGLGTACYNITKSLSKKNIEIDFVLPKSSENQNGVYVNLLTVDCLTTKLTTIDSLLQSYMTHESYFDTFQNIAHFNSQDYKNNLIDEVYRYAQIAKQIAANTPHDVIHCHDWMTLPAGIEAQKISRKPLIAHIHSTEMDRSGGKIGNARIIHIEAEGLNKANKIIAVSNLTKNKITTNYNIPEEKIEVIYNGINKEEFADNLDITNPFQKKIVLFLGRITLHKGPDYFLQVAQKVLKQRNDVVFIVSGSGDMYHKIIEMSCELNIGDKVLFTGFLRDEKLKKIYKMANLYVMPSVSEPFGITPLEALASGTPVLISKQSGVSEVLTNCLKVDFWNIDEMTNKIISVIDNPALQSALTTNGYKEIDKLNWDSAANKIIDIYNTITLQPFYFNS